MFAINLQAKSKRINPVKRVISVEENLKLALNLKQGLLLDMIVAGLD